jgi:hypothetical protein
MTPAAAIEAAKGGLEALGLHRSPGIAAALAGATAGAPLLVERLDRPDRAYYLVPWIGGRGVELVVQVDVSSGTMAGATLLPLPLPRLVIPPEEARRAALGEGTSPLAAGEPRLVWLPCRESASPLRPFYQVLTGAGNVYVGMDAAVHSRLTPFGKGG